MSSTEFFVIEAVGPVGAIPVVKQAIDTYKALIDFSQWLDVGEIIGLVSNFAIQANPSSSFPSWQTDFPFAQSTSAPPADTNPLTLAGATVINSGTQVQLEVSAGTPGLTYMVSFLVTVSPTQRAKEIDVLVSVNLPVNSLMITSITPPAQSVTVVSATVALPFGTVGSVNIQNTSGAAITITMPPNPVLDQTLNFKDVNGNAGTYSVTLQGASGALIDAYTTYVLRTNGAAAQLVWTGSKWSVR